MKKRLLAMLIVLALSVSMLTVCASAVTPSINLERRENAHGANWVWNGRTQTLSLYGGSIDAANGIYIDCDATILVDDDTDITGFISVDGELTIEGDGELYIYSNDTTIVVEDDLFIKDADIEIYGDVAIECGGSVTVESSVFDANCYDGVIAADEDIEFYNSEVYFRTNGYGLYADGDIEILWCSVEGRAFSSQPTIFAEEDVLIEACDLRLGSARTSTIWAGDNIRLRDMDLNEEVYKDDLDIANYPIVTGLDEVTALFYDHDDEPANLIISDTSISAYADAILFIAALDEGEPADYNDVSSSDWFADAVDYVSSEGLMIGTGRKTFSPNETVSNAMAWMILARINDAYTVGSAYWYDAAQNFVVTNGLSDGINPNGAISREAFITMLFKSNGSYCVRDLSSFADASSISESAVEAMRWAVENGIIKGTDGKLNPKGYMTRAELAEILMRLG